MRKHLITLLTACMLAGAQTVPARKAATKAAPKAAPKPVPAEYKVKFETTKGDVVIQVHHDWSPLGADHFYELVTKHYYNDNAFFRAIKGFVVQFGMNGDPKVTSLWNKPIKDDGKGQPNKPGTVTFAKTSQPDSRTTHIFINLGDNSDSLDSMGFTPFGEVISGMDVVQNLYMGYGDGPPGGAGPDQEALTHGGNTYLRKQFPLLDYIKTVTVIDPPPPAAPAKAPVSHKAPVAHKAATPAPKQ